MGICASKKETSSKKDKKVILERKSKSIKEIQNDNLEKIIFTTELIHLNSDLLSLEVSQITPNIKIKNKKNGEYIGKDKYFTLAQYTHFHNLYQPKQKIHKLRKPINFTEKDYLGKGAFGIIIKGFDQNNKLTMVVKKISLANKVPSQILQIKKEIKILKKLSHKNIILYFGYKITKNTLSLYLEYAGLKSLDIMLKEYGTFKTSVVKNYTKQILNGLAYLHFKGIIHRDLKGGNVLVNNEGIVKLADFGCAKNIGSIFKSYAGSFGWMSPEMYKGVPYGRQTDIWSLGCTVYEMCFGTSPFRKNRKKLLEFEDSHIFFPSVIDAQCEDFIRKCLKRVPEERWNVVDLLEHGFVKDVDVNVSGIFKNSLDLITYITLRESGVNSLKGSMFRGVGEDGFYEQSDGKKSERKSVDTREMLETKEMGDSVFDFVENRGREKSLFFKKGSHKSSFK